MATSTVLLQKYALDTVALAARLLGRTWKGRWVDACLLPTLEALAGGSPPVQRSAEAALLAMAEAAEGASPLSKDTPHREVAIESAVQHSKCKSVAHTVAEQPPSRVATAAASGSPSAVAAPGPSGAKAREMQLLRLLHSNSDYLVAGLAARLR